MRLDVIELKEFYDGTELGRTTKELINRILDNKINAETGSLTVGFGFACPFLENKIKDTGNKNFLLLMPSEQGVISWPSKSKSVTALVDEVSWPVNTSAADLILISHGLEVSDNQDLLLQEVLRVLKDSGKLVILVPNRTGFWARSDLTPFGFGRPYSVSQLSKLLIDNKFQILVTSATLLMPPTDNKFLFNSFKFIDQITTKYTSKVLGGVLVILAKKQIHLANTIKISDTIKVPLEIFDGLIKPKPKPQ